MLKKMVVSVLLMLVSATIGYGAMYTSDFEDGTTQNWYTGGGSPAVVSPGAGGSNYALRVWRGDGGNVYIYTESGFRPEFIGNLKSKYGDLFHYRWDMKDHDAESSLQVAMVFGFFGNTWKRTFGALPQEWVTYDTGVLNANWTDAEAQAAGWTYTPNPNNPRTWRDMMTGSDGGLQYVYFWSDGSAPGNGGAYYDNVKIETIPEPATIVMLCLGGLMLRRKSA